MSDMYVCTKSFLKTTTNSSCVCTHLANKADSDSTFMFGYKHFQNIFLCVHHNRNLYNLRVNDNFKKIGSCPFNKTHNFSSVCTYMCVQLL